jgi:hypothetical protein
MTNFQILDQIEISSRTLATNKYESHGFNHQNPSNYP